MNNQCENCGRRLVWRDTFIRYRFSVERRCYNSLQGASDIPGLVCPDCFLEVALRRLTYLYDQEVKAGVTRKEDDNVPQGDVTEKDEHACRKDHDSSS